MSEGEKKSRKSNKKSRKKSDEKVYDVKKKIVTLDTALDKLEEALEKKDEGELLDVIKTIETAAVEEAREKKSPAEPPEKTIVSAGAESEDATGEEEHPAGNLRDIRNLRDAIDYFSNLSNEEICCYGIIFIAVSLIIIASALKNLGFYPTLIVIAALVFISYRLKLWRI